MNRKFSFLLLALLCLKVPAVLGDPVSELAAFSVFDKVDLNDLAKSDVKTMHGPPMGSQFLSVQSCYVVNGSPAQHAEALKQWDPTKHRELKVFLHGDLPGSPTPANFSALKNAPDNGSVTALVAATQKLSSELQISKDEAKKLNANATAAGGAIPPPIVSFWSDLLAERARAFASGGTAAEPSYDHTGDSIRVNDEVNSLLKQQDKIRKQFSGLISETGIGRGAGSLPAELYWELLDVDDQGVVTLGASYGRAGTGGTYQAADVLYYASGGYYVALTFYQMWPIPGGKTLVWRGDMISAASLASLHGVERLGSESAMMKDISKAVTLFRKDSSR
jgi:hypothetical protein